MIRYPYEIINVEKKYELPNNLVDEHNRYVELKLTDYDTMPQPERNELNDLSELLYPYNISSGDWNKFQEITANLQKFITIDMVNYINESYFTMEDVRNEIDIKIDIFKTGEMIEIIKECLKRWGGGDFMGKTMIPMSTSINSGGGSYTYTNKNGGMLVCKIYTRSSSGMSAVGMTVIQDGKIVINKDYRATDYCIGYNMDADEYYQYIFPFNESITIINNHFVGTGPQSGWDT